MKTIGSVKVTAANCQYEWKIPEFPSRYANNLRYRSPDFYVSNATWIMTIYPNGDAAYDATGYVSIYLHRKLNQDPAAIKFSFGIKTVDNIIVNRNEGVFEDPGRGWPCFIKRTEILQRKSELMPLGTLTIVCLMDVREAAPNLVEAHGDLAGDFKNLYFSEENADVILQLNQRAFPSHKVILAARSPVFAAMFKNDMTEKKTGVVNISDCDGEVFHHFLLFLYSGELDFSKCNVCHLYTISDKYEVLKLKLMCVDFMTRNLSVENFYEISSLGDRFGESKLLTEMQSFFNKNFEAIVSSKNWESLLRNNFRLANMFLKAMASKVKIVE